MFTSLALQHLHVRLRGGASGSTRLCLEKFNRAEERERQAAEEESKLAKAQEAIAELRREEAAIREQMLVPSQPHQQVDCHSTIRQFEVC